MTEQSTESGSSNVHKTTVESMERKPKRYSKLSEDEQVCKTFVDLVQHKVDHGLLSIPKGTAERKTLEEVVIYPGFYAGAFVGMAQFFIMRRAPIYLMNRHLRQTAKQQKDVIQKSSVFREDKWTRPWTILLDASFSMATGTCVWLVSLDKEKMFQTTADIPLMEGKSNISDSLCGDFIQEYNNIRPAFWDEYKDDSLTYLQNFIQNCQKRQAYERQLKREMMIDETTESISLPTKVPQDILQVEEEERQSLDWATIEDFEEEETESDTDDTFWTNTERK